MNLLGAILYDPAVAVSKATSALLATTAFDTTNLRLAITVPSHGMVRFRLACTVVGATTVPVVLLGVLNGATVIGRATPEDFPGTMNAATQTTRCYAEFIATGLAAGAMNCDAAYAVQVIVASTNIKYGGPNTNAGGNAWGAFCFEAWDPRPLTLALGGGVNVTEWNGTAVSAPATAGIPDINVKNINNVSASSVTTVNADQGTTQPVNFTGTGTSALVKSDMTDIAGSAVSASTAQLGVNLVNIAGSAVSTSTAQLGVNAVNWAGGAIPAPNVTGVPKSDIAYTLGTASKGAAGYVAPDWAQVGNPTTAIDLSGTTIKNLDNNPPGYPANFGSLSIDTSGRVDIGKLLGTASAGTAGYAAIDWAHISGPTTVQDLSGTTIKNLDGNTVQTGDSYARLGAPAGASIAADIAEVEGETDTISTNTGAAAIATAVWTDAIAGDFTTASTIGKSIMNGVALGTGLTINAYTGNTVQTGDSFARLGAPAGASVSADIAEIAAETDGIAAIPTTPVLAAHFDTIMGTPVTSVSADIAEIAAETDSIAAIKTQTDKLAFTVANKVDANIHAVNDTTVNGAGTAGSPWGP